MWKHKLVLVYIYDPATLALIKCPFSKFLKKKCFTRLFLQIFWMDYHIIMKYKTFPDSVDSDSLWSDFFVKNLGIFCKYPKDVAFTPAPECRSQCQQWGS